MQCIVILLLQVLNYGLIHASNTTNLQTLVRTKMIRITKRSLSADEDSYVFDKNEVVKNPRILNSRDKTPRKISLRENELTSAKDKFDVNDLHGRLRKEKQFEEWVGKRDNSRNKKLGKIGYQNSWKYGTKQHEKDTLNAKIGLSIFMKQLMKNHSEKYNYPIHKKNNLKRKYSLINGYRNNKLM